MNHFEKQQQNKFEFAKDNSKNQADKTRITHFLN